MKTLDEIKKLMSDGETAQADEALKELLAAEPENLEAKMLYGTCRQLLGDEETFKRIHDEIAPMMENKDGTELQSETVSLWRKYHALWITLIAGALILAGIGTVGWYFGREILDMFGVSVSDIIGAHQSCLYAGPSYYKRRYGDESTQVKSHKEFLLDEKNLYAGPEFYEKTIDKAPVGNIQ